MTDSPAVAAARRLAEDVLLANALVTDRSDRIPAANLDALADAGLYGIFVPEAMGGLGADGDDVFTVIEVLASGCVTTALVWMQHFGLLGRLLAPGPLGEAWLADATAGRRRGAIAFGGLLPGPPILTAEPGPDDGWTLHGHAPWVSGWGMVDTVLVAARGPDDTIVSVALDAVEGAGVRADRVRLAAVDASVTVRLDLEGVVVPAERVAGVEPYDPAASLGRSLRGNGSLALGVARRCCTWLGDPALDAELDDVRRALDTADDDGMAAARAAASAFAARAATALVVDTGSRSVRLDDHAQRLHREAMFLLVFGSRPAVKASLSDLVRRPPRP